MKVLFLVNTFEYFLSHRLALAQEAQSRGWEVHVASPPSLGAGVPQGIVHHPIPLHRRGVEPFGELRGLARIRAVVRKVQPALIHAIGPKCIIYGGLQARSTGVKALVCLVPGLGYVFTLGGVRGRLAQWCVLLAYKIALLHKNKRVIFQNPVDMALFLAKGVCRQGEALLVRGSGVRPDDWPATPEPAGPPLVAFPSRLLREKGIELFVNAAISLKREGIQARFVIVGAADSGNPTSIGANELNAWAKEGIEYWGFRRNMQEVFSQVHVVCLPTYRREGIPKVLIEAAAAGKPIVTSDMPGCRDIVRHGINGILVPPRDINSIKNAIRVLVCEPQLRLQMGTAGRRIVVAEFSSDTVINETLGAYNDLIEARGAAEWSVNERG